MTDVTTTFHPVILGVTVNKTGHTSNRGRGRTTHNLGKDAKSGANSFYAVWALRQMLVGMGIMRKTSSVKLTPPHWLPPERPTHWASAHWLADQCTTPSAGTLHYRVPHPAHWRPLGSAWVQW